MSAQTIQSQDIKVAEVFQAFYVVPDYQREYVWETEQVEQLLTDINNELAGVDPLRAPEYFIGSIVVCPGKDGVLDLIDGQQRMTTIFLTLCAIRDRFKELIQTPPGPLSSQIAATSTDALGNDQFRYRLDLQYADSGDAIVRIAKEEAHLATGSTRSIVNIINAYQTALAFLRREMDDDTAKLKAYYAYLTRNVKLIRIQTEDVAKALKIFETINDRGVGLDAMDLLKNLLFMKANRTQFDQLKTIWKKMQDTIFAVGERPLRFLRYFIVSKYDVELLREDEIYKWFADNEKICKYGSAPIEFVEELYTAAQAYQQFLNGNDHRGRKNRFLENLILLGGKAARQHLIMLLAGRHLSEPLFDLLAREVENLFFVYVIVREPTTRFEKTFGSWSVDVRKLKTPSEFDAFIKNTFYTAKADMSQRFDEAIRRLYFGSVQQYRLRYILAKLTQHVDLQGFGETDGTKWLGRYTSNGFEIEHIYPQTPSPSSEAEFGIHADSNVANRLGNLTLVEKSINASLGNSAYSVKRAVYLQSQLLLTRAIAERPSVGANTRIDVAVASIEPFDSWNEDAVNKRQEVILKLSRTIWNVPTKSGTGGAHS